MTRRVKEFIEIKDHASLDELICKLKDVQDSLPADAEAELRLRGDDVFGRKLTISFFRAQTDEEAECEARYAETHKQREPANSAPELGMDRHAHGGRKKLRIVAGNRN